MDELTPKLERLAPSTRDEPALGAVRDALHRHRRQRRGLQAALGVLLVALAGGVLALQQESSELPPATSPTSTTLVTDVNLVPATFDGRPRLDSVRDLPPCEDSNELEVWATSVLDDDYVEIPPAGPVPEGPMEPTTVDDVARLAPVLVGQVTPTASACLTALRGPNDLLAWEQRDVGGTLLARAVAAPWAARRGPMSVLILPPGAQPVSSVVLRRGVGFGHPILAGGGLWGGAGLVTTDGPNLLQLGTVNYGVRRLIEVYDPRSLSDGPTADSDLANHVAANLVLAAWHDTRTSFEPSDHLPMLLPSGWAYCGDADPPSIRPPWTIVQMACDGHGHEMLFREGAEQPAGAAEVTIRGRTLLHATSEDRRVLAAAYRTSTSQRYLTVDAPEFLSADVLAQMLESAYVIANPAAQLPLAPEPPTTGTLGDLRAGLADRLERASFSGKYGAGNDQSDPSLPLSWRQVEVLLRGNPERRVSLSFVDVGPDTEWWHAPSSPTTFGATEVLRTEPWPILIVPETANVPYVTATTRCGRWELSTRTERANGGEQIAVDVLETAFNAFGCG